MQEATPVVEFINADIPRARTTAAVVVLKAVNWRIQAGDFWAVGAMAGTGKTDLLCTAAALQRPLQGTHLIFGKDTRQMDEQQLVHTHQKIGMVFDSGRLFGDLTVAENLALPLAYHSGVKARHVIDRVNAVLELTGLEKLREDYPRQISRSLHQRVGLARALILEPELLFVDNPLQSTDPRQGRWWLEFLCALNAGHPFYGKRPISIAIATDDFRPWPDVARQFAVIKSAAFDLIGGNNELRRSNDAVVQELMLPAFEED